MLETSYTLKFEQLLKITVKLKRCLLFAEAKTKKNSKSK